MNVEIKYKIEHRNVRYPRLEFKGVTAACNITDR
jgi:hypothetical protein